MDTRSGWFVMIIGVIVVGGPVVACAGETSEALDRLNELGGALRAQPGWSASYNQEYVPSGMSLGEIVDGTVWIAWPDSALFASGDPIQRWMGLSGLDVRLLDLENGTCDDHKLNAEEWERIPLVAVLEPERAIDQFIVEVFGSTGLSLTPREGGGVDRVEIEIGSDGLPAQVVVHDPQGATSTFDFKDWRPITIPPGGLWLPEPPADIECIAG